MPRSSTSGKPPSTEHDAVAEVRELEARGGQPGHAPEQRRN